MAITGISSEYQKSRFLCEELYVNGKQIASAQATKISDITVTATTGTLPTANGAITIANAATPTVAELQEFCVELNAKMNAVIDALEGAGISASA